MASIDEAEKIMAQAAELENQHKQKLQKIIADYKLRELPDEQLRTLSNACLGELGRRYTLETAKSRIEDAAHDFEQAVQAEGAKKLADLDVNAVVGPGEKLADNDVVWINVSGAFLSPHVAGPEAYPMGWRRDEPLEPSDALAWEPGVDVKPGDLRSHDGTVYKCLQGHTTQTGWEPDRVPALWAIA